MELTNDIEINQVYNGNCFDLFKKMKDNSVDHVFTSPPYNRKRNDKYQFYDDQCQKAKNIQQIDGDVCSN